MKNISTIFVLLLSSGVVLAEGFSGGNYASGFSNQGQGVSGLSPGYGAGLGTTLSGSGGWSNGQGVMGIGAGYGIPFGSTITGSGGWSNSPGFGGMMPGYGIGLGATYSGSVYGPSQFGGYYPMLGQKPDYVQGVYSNNGGLYGLPVGYGGYGIPFGYYLAPEVSSGLPGHVHDSARGFNNKFNFRAPTTFQPQGPSARGQ
jgi:hypothetical protein